MKNQSILASVAVYLILVTSNVVAQSPPVNSPAYHAVHHPDSVYNPNNQGAQQPAEVRSTGYWESTWGALAPSSKEGVLGSSVGAKSKKEAEQIALRDCQSKGGGACVVDISYSNQCAVMVIGDKFFGTHSSATIEKATERGLERCHQRDSNCRVFHTSCTKPIFHKY